MNTDTRYTTIASTHSLQRSKERVGLNKKRAERQIDLAYQRGKRAREFRRKRDRAFLERHSREGEVEAVVYNGYCYLFTLDTRVCITVFQVPVWFGKKWRDDYDIDSTAEVLLSM